MKTRIIKTDLWKKLAKIKAPKDARLLFAHLLTCQEINMCGVFELPDEYIEIGTGLSEKDIAKAKLFLSEKKKVFFYDAWVYVVNAEEHNNYKKSEKTMVAYEREIKAIPKKIMDYFNKLLDSTIDTTIDSTMLTTPIFDL